MISDDQSVVVMPLVKIVSRLVRKIILNCATALVEDVSWNGRNAVIQASYRRLIMVVMVLFFAVTFLFSHAWSAEAPLPAEAQEAVSRGLMAAGQEAWELAIHYFTEAQKAAERDPGILYYLGLAHTKAGHELAGAAWLRAYLNAAPQAHNAGAVDKEILRLEDIAKANTKKIFEAALAASRQIPSDEVRKKRLFYIFDWQIFTGDLDGAQKTKKEVVDLWVSLSPDEAADLKMFFDSSLWNNYVRYLATIGEVQKAEDAFSRIDYWTMKIEAACSIAQGHTWIGNFAGAEKRLALTESALSNLDELCADDIKKGHYKNSDDPRLREEQTQLMLTLADVYAVNGQAADYKRVVAKANEIAERYKLSAEAHSKIAAALQDDPMSKNRRVTLSQMDPLKEWIDLAMDVSKENVAVELKGRLAWAKSDTSSDGIVNRLAAVALTLSKSLNRILAQEKRCAIAETLSSLPAASKPSSP